MSTIGVLFQPDSSEQSVIDKVFGSDHTVEYLGELESKDRFSVLGKCEALLAGNVRNELHGTDFAHLTSLRMLQILPAGANRIPFDSIAPGVLIASNVGAYAEPMAEHVLAMILALAKNITVENDKLKAGEWDRDTPSQRLRGANVGIVGFGGIGKATAHLLAPFDVRVSAINRTGKTDETVNFAGTLSDLKSVVAGADIVVLAIPLTRQTRSLIGAPELGAMKSDAIFINVARGAIVDEDALWQRASTCASFRVGLDVWWDEPFSDGRFQTRTPLLSLPNVIGSPHNSGHVPGIGIEGVERAAQNILRFLSGEVVTGIVDPAEYA